MNLRTILFSTAFLINAPAVKNQASATATIIPGQISVLLNKLQGNTSALKIPTDIKTEAIDVPFLHRLLKDEPNYEYFTKNLTVIYTTLANHKLYHTRALYRLDSLLQMSDNDWENSIKYYEQNAAKQKNTTINSGKNFVSILPVFTYNGVFNYDSELTERKNHILTVLEKNSEESSKLESLIQTYEEDFLVDLKAAEKRIESAKYANLAYDILDIIQQIPSEEKSQMPNETTKFSSNEKDPNRYYKQSKYNEKMKPERDYLLKTIYLNTILGDKRQKRAQVKKLYTLDPELQLTLKELDIQYMLTIKNRDRLFDSINRHLTSAESYFFDSHGNHLNKNETESKSYMDEQIQKWEEIYLNSKNKLAEYKSAANKLKQSLEEIEKRFSYNQPHLQLELLRQEYEFVKRSRNFSSNNQ